MTSAVNAKLLFLIAGSTIATVAASWVALHCLRALRHTLQVLEGFRKRRKPLCEVRPGYVALRGRAVAIDPLVAEESGRTAIYVAYTADRWDRSTALGGLSGQWIRTLQEESAAPFELTDGEHAVLVDPEGATFVLPDPQMIVREDNGTSMRFREAMIPDGEDVVVVGTATQRGGFAPTGGYRGHSYRLAIGQDPNKRVQLTVALPRMLGSVLLQAILRAAGVLPALVLALLTLWLISGV